jgi:hypothetical protein
VALSWALSLATGKAWYGREVKQGPVFYIVGEGAGGIAKRCKAWAIANTVKLANYPFYISSKPMRALDSGSMAEVRQTLDFLRLEHGRPASVFIDTLNRNIGGADENSTTDMTAFIAAIDDVFGPDCLRCIVHHTGHGNKDRARGSSALLGALDAEYRLTKNEDKTATLSNTKMKDEAMWSEDMAFAPRSVVVLEQDFDDDVTSLVLEETTPPVKQVTVLDQAINYLASVETASKDELVDYLVNECGRSGAAVRKMIHDQDHKRGSAKKIYIHRGQYSLFYRGDK